MDDYIECCASGSCEVCRRPQGYTPEQRQRIADLQRKISEAEYRWDRLMGRG
jgi:hypothetical protein